MNIIFEQHEEEVYKNSLDVFRSFNKEDVLSDVADPDHGLLTSAFEDIETLLQYTNIVNESNELDMSSCLALSNHLNSIEERYKNIPIFNSIVQESMNGIEKKIIVSETLSKGVVVLLAAAVAAVIGIISMILGKKSSSGSKNSPAVIDQKSKTVIENITKASASLKDITDEILKTPVEKITRKQLEDCLQKTKSIKEKSPDVIELTQVLEKTLGSEVKKEDIYLALENNDRDVITVPSKWLSCYTDYKEYETVDYAQSGAVNSALKNYTRVISDALDRRLSLTQLVFYVEEVVYSPTDKEKYFDVFNYIKDKAKIGSQEQKQFFEASTSHVNDLKDRTKSKAGAIRKPSDQREFTYGPLAGCKLVFEIMEHDGSAIGTIGRIDSSNKKSKDGVPSNYSFVFLSLDQILEMSKEMAKMKSSKNYISELLETEKTYSASLKKLTDFLKHVEQEIKKIEHIDQDKSYDKKITSFVLGRLRALVNVIKTNILLIEQYDNIFKEDYVNLMAFYSKMASECADVKKVKVKLAQVKL